MIYISAFYRCGKQFYESLRCNIGPYARVQNPISMKLPRHYIFVNDALSTGHDAANDSEYLHLACEWDLICFLDRCLMTRTLWPGTKHTQLELADWQAGTLNHPQIPSQPLDHPPTSD